MTSSPIIYGHVLYQALPFAGDRAGVAVRARGYLEATPLWSQDDAFLVTHLPSAPLLADALALLWGLHNMPDGSRVHVGGPDPRLVGLAERGITAAAELGWPAPVMGVLARHLARLTFSAEMVGSHGTKASRVLIARAAETGEGKRQFTYPLLLAHLIRPGRLPPVASMQDDVWQA